MDMNQNNLSCSNIKRLIVISIILFVSIIGIILYYQEKQLNNYISNKSYLNEINNRTKRIEGLLQVIINETIKKIIDNYKLPSYHPINKQFKDCFPLSDYNDIIEKLFNINYEEKTYTFNKINNILPKLLELNNYINYNDDNINDNDNDDNDDINDNNKYYDEYYDEDFNELNMNTSEYYEYLWNKYVEFSKTINSSKYNIYNLNKYNFMYNLKYYFNMKNKNKYIHKISYKIINNIYGTNNTNNIKHKKRCILNKKLTYIKNYDITYEHSLIPINDKDYKNHFNNNYNLNQLNNYYGYMCNSHSNLCGNLNNYYNENDDNDNYLYYYPYFKSYNVNVFNYIFNRMYKSFVNFDIEKMINNVSNINKMSENILIGLPIDDKNFNLIYDMFPNIIKPIKII